MKPHLLLLATVVTAFSLTGIHAADADKKPAQKFEKREKGPGGPWRGDHGKHGGPRGGGPGHIWKDLNLTEDQKARVKSVMESKKPLLDAIREEARQKSQVVLDDAEKEIRTFLTPEQQKVLDDSKKLREDAKNLQKAKENLKKTE